MRPPRFSPFCLTAALLTAAAQAPAADTLRVKVEQSASPAGPWQHLPLDRTTTDANGDPIVPAVDGVQFFRARIEPITGGGGATEEFAKLPAALIKRANTELEAGKAPGEDAWPPDAEIDPVVHLIFDPAYNGGTTPAFYEVKILAPLPRIPKGPLLRNAPEGCTDRSLGYLMLALNPGDFPVPDLAMTGPTPTERLQCAAGDRNIKVLRFGPTYFVAEDASGNPVANLGAHPFRPDPALAETLKTPVEWNKGEDDAEGTVSRPPPSAFGGHYASYVAFKTDYLTNPIYQRVRANRVAYAAQEWAAERGELPAPIQLATGQTVTLVPAVIVASVTQDVEGGTSIVRTQILAGGGLKITGSLNGHGSLRMVLGDGSVRYQAVLVGLGGAGAGPRATQTYPYWKIVSDNYAGTYAMQPKYNQMDDALDWSGYVGCGPNAWAIYFAWLERNNGVKAAFGAFNTVTAPPEFKAGQTSNRQALYQVLAQLSDLCDTINVPFSDETATMPGDLAEGGIDYLYLPRLLQMVKCSWQMKWAGLFGTLDTSDEGGASHTRSAIKAGFPAVTGLGEYWHIVVAYGYRAEELYLAPGVSGQLIRRRIKCNMGWGPGIDPQWHSFWDVFFTSNYKVWNGPNAQ
jgi:hypothetical protein